jgi:hypothetical protein
MKAANTDAVGVLRWGLRRYRALFLACVLVGAVVAPWVAAQRAATVEAEALVIATGLDMDEAALPRYGQTVFTNGEVARAIGDRFGDLGDYEEVIPNRVFLVAEQDNIVFRVVGVDTDPQRAADIANLAADTFIESLNVAGGGVGTFALQSPAEPPANTDSTRELLFAGAVGLAAGLLLGLAVLSLLLVARRPVISAADAEDTAGVPVLGTVAVPRTPGGLEARPEDFAGLVPVCRRLLSLPTPTVVLVSRPAQERVRKQLSKALASILVRVREVRFVGSPDAERIAAQHAPGSGLAPSGVNGRTGPIRRPLTLIDSSEPLDLVQPPQSTAAVLVVPEGISSAALRAAVVEHLGGSAEARLLLVRKGRRMRGSRPSEGRLAEPASATASAAGPA